LFQTELQKVAANFSQENPTPNVYKIYKKVSALKPALHLQINHLNHLFMKAMLFVLVFFIASNVFSQEKILTVSNNDKGKVSEFKQNQRVRIKTAQGGKINGKLFIVDDTQIMIKNIVIPLSGISQIKPNPILLNVLISGTFFIIGGFGILGGLVAIAWSGTAVGIIAMGIGAAMITAGVISPNLLPATKINSSSHISVTTRMQ